MRPHLRRRTVTPCGRDFAGATPAAPPDPSRCHAGISWAMTLVDTALEALPSPLCEIALRTRPAGSALDTVDPDRGAAHSHRCPPPAHTWSQLPERAENTVSLSGGWLTISCSPLHDRVVSPGGSRRRDLGMSNTRLAVSPLSYAAAVGY